MERDVKCFEIKYAESDSKSARCIPSPMGKNELILEINVDLELKILKLDLFEHDIIINNKIKNEKKTNNFILKFKMDMNKMSDLTL